MSTSSWTVYEGAVVHTNILIDGVLVFVTLRDVWLTDSKDRAVFQVQKDKRGRECYDRLDIQSYKSKRTYTRTDSNFLEVS